MSREGKFEPEPLYLKHFSDSTKIAFEADSDGPKSDDFPQISHIRFCCVFLVFLMHFGVQKGSNSVMLGSKPLYLNALGDFGKICPGDDFDDPGSGSNCDCILCEFAVFSLGFRPI